MSQAERKPNEYERDENVYCVDDAANYARDIVRKSETSVIENSDVAKVAWEKAGVEYELYICDQESAQPQYILDYNDTQLGTRKVFSFPDFNGALRVVSPKHHTQWFGDTASDVPELMVYLATNTHNIHKPTISKSGNRRFEAIAAHYALTELLESSIAPNIASVVLMSDPERRDEKRRDCVDATLEQGIEIDDEIYVYTRSSGAVRLVLEDYFKEQRKKSAIK